MEAYIEFNQITKKYGSQLALDQVSFSLKKGQCTGLLGINGAGKTTTLKTLVGLIQPTSGLIQYNGTTVNPMSQAYKEKIGFLAQHPNFHDWMTGYEFLSYVADLYGYKLTKKKQRIEEVLNIVQLTNARNKRIKGYSGGMKQRLGIAQAIFHKPEFLLLDEPVSALDPEGRYQIIQLLNKIKKETTILLSTHILHDADSICDNVVVLHHGKKIIETDLQGLKATYQEPVITIKMIEPLNEKANLLQSYPWIESIVTHDRLATIKVTKKEEALKKLPQLLLEQQILFESFQVVEPSLEDIFLRLVKEHV